MNSLFVIHPYKTEGVWVFDDAKVGLEQEPFVSGADTMLDEMTSDIPAAEQGVTAIFSAAAFPGCQYRFEWRREEHGGNWYYNEQFDHEGWLCPALLKYFDTAPEQLFVQIKAKSE
jgi:hypothetical protein